MVCLTILVSRFNSGIVQEPWIPENRTRFELREVDLRRNREASERERERERERRGGTMTVEAPGLTRKTVTDEERPRDLLEER